MRVCPVIIDRTYPGVTYGHGEHGSRGDWNGPYFTCKYYIGESEFVEKVGYARITIACGPVLETEHV